VSTEQKRAFSYKKKGTAKLHGEEKEKKKKKKSDLLNIRDEFFETSFRIFLQNSLLLSMFPETNKSKNELIFYYLYLCSLASGGILSRTDTN